MTDPRPADIHIRRQGRAGRITLDRPKAFNALTWNMVKTISAALAAWRDDAAIACVIIDGAGDRGLCAGGDVRWLYDMRPQAPDQALQFWREEYTLNYTIAHYPKPYIAIMDGLVMGGGVGVSAHGRERIVTERSQIAMPETGIGLVPDVGGTYLLARAMGRLGVYLGLTGARMSASDAIQAGFADTFVPSSELPKLIAGLSDGIDTIEDVIEAASAPVPPSELLAKRDLIDRLFAGDTRAEVDAALLKSADPLARKAAADLALRSPLAVALCLEALRRQGSQGTLADALKTEYRLVSRLYEGGEFIEGVRALIVDKDKAPKWRPSSPGQVTPAMIDGYFAPRPDDWLV